MTTELKKQILIHFIKGRNRIAVKTEYHVPRKGDEIRLNDNKFYRVKKVVWTYDEYDSPYSRVNIGVIELQ